MVAHLWCHIKGRAGAKVGHMRGLGVKPHREAKVLQCGAAEEHARVVLGSANQGVTIIKRRRHSACAAHRQLDLHSAGRRGIHLEQDVAGCQVCGQCDTKGAHMLRLGDALRTAWDNKDPAYLRG